jgi:DNA invertase Pin-like site-specific DNA recombinase
MDKAVIYCRVSTKRQSKEGNGLASQATRCREFARYRNLEVIEVFQDSESGSLIDRPDMQAMLKFARAHRKDNLTIIIDDLSRLARGMEAIFACVPKLPMQVQSLPPQVSSSVKTPIPCSWSTC